MEIEVIEEKENPVLHRKEVSFKVVHKGPTPRRKEVREKLIANLSADKKLFVVDSLESGFGSREERGLAKIYEDIEAMVETEPRHNLKSNFSGKELAEMGVKVEEEA